MFRTARFDLPKLHHVIGEFLRLHRTHGHPVSVRSAMTYVRANYPDCRMSEGDLSDVIERDAIDAGYNLRLDSHRDHR